MLCRGQSRHAIGFVEQCFINTYVETSGVISMSVIIGISGSLRVKSYNSALLRAATQLMPGGSTLEMASIKGIPLYDGDLEDREGIPPAVTTLKERIIGADALLLVTPEYNNSIPGVFKNAIDWLSRGSDAKKVFANRPIAVIGASPGGFGTILAQQAWLPVLRTLQTRPWFEGRLQVSHAAQVFNDGGELIDDKIREQLKSFLQGFSGFVRGESKVS
jgi:chromate reductase, NAD(P)H dehydrogenase (quinone)